MFILVLLGLYGPRIKIEEGHNVFIPSINNKFDSYQLPKFIENKLNEDFFQIYPKETWCLSDQIGCWIGLHRKGPTWAFSLDSFWQNPKYSRIISTIDFQNQNHNRFGHVNNGHPYIDKTIHGHYDWWNNLKGNLNRGEMPYFLVIEIPEELKMSKIKTSGQLYLESNGEFNQLSEGNHLIDENFISKKIWGIGIIQPISIKLKPNFKVLFTNTIYKILAIILLIISILVTQISKKDKIFIVTSFSLFALFSILIFDLKIFETDIFMWPRSDGLTYKSFGRNLTYYLLSQKFYQFFLGEESIFYFMPGFRYFRVLEASLFGESDLMNFIYLFILLCSIIKISHQYLKNYTIYGFIIFFTVIGSQNSFLDGMTLKTYANYNTYGVSEPLGYALFLVGFYLAITSLEDFLKEKIFLSSFFFALAILNRPNLLIAIGLILFYLTLISFIRKKYIYIVFLILGFIPFFLMPLHNYYFGNAFVLMTSASNVDANLLVRPRDYFFALKDLFSTEILNRPYLDKVSIHLGRWSANYHWLLVLFIFINLKKFIKKQDHLMFLAILGTQIPLFFWHPDGRYAFLSRLLICLTCVKIISESTILKKIKYQTSFFANNFFRKS